MCARHSFALCQRSLTHLGVIGNEKACDDDRFVYASNCELCLGKMHLSNHAAARVCVGVGVGVGVGYVRGANELRFTSFAAVASGPTITTVRVLENSGKKNTTPTPTDADRSEKSYVDRHDQLRLQSMGVALTGTFKAASLSDLLIVSVQHHSASDPLIHTYTHSWIV